MLMYLPLPAPGGPSRIDLIDRFSSASPDRYLFTAPTNVAMTAEQKLLPSLHCRPSQQWSNIEVLITFQVDPCFKISRFTVCLIF